MNEIKEIRLDKGFFEKEFKKGLSLFILEKHLGSCPSEWFECVSYIFTQGLEEREGHSYLIMLDDDKTEKLMKLVAKDRLKLYVFPERKNIDKEPVWEIGLHRTKNEKTNVNETVYMGGEMLRIFCDRNNIYYSSFLKDNLLLSGTNMLYQKALGEDCRKVTELPYS